MKKKNCNELEPINESKNRRTSTNSSRAKFFIAMENVDKATGKAIEYCTPSKDENWFCSQWDVVILKDCKMTIILNTLNRKHVSDYSPEN